MSPLALMLVTGILWRNTQCGENHPMQHLTIERLIEELDRSYPKKWRYYGTIPVPPEDNMGFKIDGTKATFSASTEGGLQPENQLDIQIEHEEPAVYIYTDELSVAEFMELIRQFFRPETDWPGWKD